MNLLQVKAWRAEQDRKSSIFCPFCISKAVRHSNNCPTRKEGFDPSTAHELTKDEREQLISQKNESK